MPLPVTEMGLTDDVSALYDRVARVERRPIPSPIESVNTVAASGSTQTLPDVGTATMHDITLTANCTFTFPAAGAGKSFSVRLVQDGTGSRTATWPAAVRWDAGTAPTLSTAASAVDTLWFACFDGSTWDAGTGGKGHA